MKSATDFTLDQKYTFTLYSSINEYTVFTGFVRGISSWVSIPASEDIDILHQNIWSQIPESVQLEVGVNSYKAYKYVCVEVEATGDIIYIGLPWISVAVRISSRTLNIPILNFDDDSTASIIAIITRAGYTVGDVEVINN